MLESHVTAKLKKSLEFDPTPSQEAVLELLSRYICQDAGMEVMLIRGYAGTGKTTLVKSLVRTLEQFRHSYVLMAPTGRAAKVLSSYTERAAYTIHKKIYRQKTAKEGVGVFVLDRNLSEHTLFIVDEASMIGNQAAEMNAFGSGNLLDDLVEYVYSAKHCRLILIGDTAQLPPVGLDVSPALNPDILKKYGLEIKEAFLDDIIRQAQGSGILVNATNLRRDMAKNPSAWPSLKSEAFEDVERISGSELIETISAAYDKNRLSGTMLVTRSNKRANQFNQGIRNQILWRDQEIATGDMLMIVRNNYYWALEDPDLDFIANGDIAEIVDIAEYQERYGFRFADVTLSFPDYGKKELDVKIMLDTLLLETASLGSEANRQLYYNILEDFPELKSKKKKYEKVREHPFYNALQVKFAYAVTCHKAQGGQWDTVFIDPGYLRDDGIDREYYRWLYTAVTRATKKLYLVNFSNRMFPGED